LHNPMRKLIKRKHLTTEEKYLIACWLSFVGICAFMQIFMTVRGR
jgi:hypothetical protein